MNRLPIGLWGKARLGCGGCASAAAAGSISFPAMAHSGFSLEQSNTSIETITVIDPRDPLFGQTFTLLFVESKSDRGKCCVVRMETGIERHIPIAVTNLSTGSIQNYPLALDLPSVRKLRAVYARLIRLSAERTEDGYPDKNSPSFSSEIIGAVPTDPIARTLGASDPGTTAESQAGTGNHLPSDHPAARRKAGGKE
jgi:hypothetical protein